MSALRSMVRQYLNHSGFDAWLSPTDRTLDMDMAKSAPQAASRHSSWWTASATAVVSFFHDH